jgi:membrane associated rhomboid family serine protease
MTSTPVGMRCPECASERTQVRTGVSGGIGALGGETPWATYILIAINVAAFLAELGGGAGATTIGTGSTLVRDGAVFGPGIEDGEYYRLVTGGFLHAGFLHIALNMFVLYVLGRLLEPAIGTPRFVVLYFTALLAGSFGALLFDPDVPTVGASGAVYGLMGAALVIARRRGAEEIVSSLGIWLAINLVFSFTVNGISVGGHLGGLVGGTLAALIIVGAEARSGGSGRGTIAMEILGMAMIGVASVAGSLWAAGQAGGVL